MLTKENSVRVNWDDPKSIEDILYEWMNNPQYNVILRIKALTMFKDKVEKNRLKSVTLQELSDALLLISETDEEKDKGFWTAIANLVEAVFNEIDKEPIVTTIEEVSGGAN